MPKESCVGFVRAERAQGHGCPLLLNTFIRMHLFYPCWPELPGAPMPPMPLDFCGPERAHGCWVDAVHVGGAGSEADSRRSHPDVS